MYEWGVARPRIGTVCGIDQLVCCTCRVGVASFESTFELVTVGQKDVRDGDLWVVVQYSTCLQYVRDARSMSGSTMNAMRVSPW